ncbi:MAG TPA: pyridoxal phosphate-dependent aminotransferase [Chthonomonadaceae bacterium]|nr:pyridoxal phosphate-dependent aminotransferase [Chthonomonadaceae bacterium]
MNAWIPKNLTAYELDTLPHAYNLTDGHAFRQWSPAEEAILDQSAQLFKSHNRRMQARIEQEYIQDFLELGKQTRDEDAMGYLMCFTASMAFEIIANYLRLNRLTLTLIEPCFDNLADIFLRHHVPTRPFPDALMEAPPATFAQALNTITTDAICLVTPNNPTGRVLSQENLECLARFCREHRKILILDNCFRAYLPRHLAYDQYRILLEADVDCFLIEDTGKTWPTAEIKAPFFAISRARALFQDTYAIYTDFLLHISPVGIKLVHAFLRLSQQDDLASIRQVVGVNRKALANHLAGTFLTPCEHPFMSMAWLRIHHPLNGFELKQILDAHGVFVLPGSHFYWSDRHQGEKYLRVALVRDADMFAEAAALMGAVCREVAGKAQAACPA